MKINKNRIIKTILKIAYKIACTNKLKNKIVFASYREDTIYGNYEYILEELRKRNLDYEYKFLYRKPKKGVLGQIRNLIYMCLAEYYLGTSKIFIIDDFYLPVYVMDKLREETYVIQVWHACGAFKKFGFSIVDKTFGANKNYIEDIKIHSNYSKVIVTSKEVVKHYGHAFNMESKDIMPIGVPRTDIFFNDKKIEKVREKLYKMYPKIKDKKIILYAPTFRGINQKNAKGSIRFDIDKVLENLEEEYIVALKMHPFVSERFDNLGNRVIDMSDYKFINDILCITDTLITDYSSIIFEFALLERKIIMYADDLEDYIDERDFYYDYESFVPGEIVKNTDELIIALHNEKNIEKIKEFKNKFFDEADGKASKRFVD
ncbi:MAG: CDP-glycerol glycerophosphotransferase family protein, partial [Clostridium sp.]|uniref:CDP-glycerol glycerophosphotransferase family protein n=1 Tax=Clostridium sp. TaxID=1506 RepID=UPI003EE48EE5